MESTNAPSLESRVENIERMLSRIETQLAELPNLVATGVDTMDGLAREANERGIDIDQRLEALVSLLELSTRPAVVKTMELAAEAAQHGPGLVAMAVDTFDKIVLDMQERGVEVCEGVDSLGKLAEMFIKPEFLQSVTTLIDVATPRALETTELIASAMVEASDAAPTKLGPLGMVRAMGKGNGKLVLGFTANLVQNLGERLSKRVEGNKQLEEGER